MVNTMYTREIETFDAEYHDELLASMKEKELLTIPDVSKMDLQPEINWEMRHDIINFMIYIHSNSRLMPHTLFLAVNILDRYISKRIMRTEHKNLVICSCLSIAAKYLEEKRRVPSVSQIMKLSGLQFTESQFTETELHILSTINFCIGHPTSEAFLDLILKDEPVMTRHVARYICEICLYDREFLKYGSSFIAYCSKMLVYQIFNYATHELILSIKASDLNFQNKLWNCLSLLIKKLQKPSSYLHLKYSDKLLSSASNVVDCFFSRYQQYKQQQLLQKRELFHLQQKQHFKAQQSHQNQLYDQSPRSPFSSFGSFSASGMESFCSSSPPNSPSVYSSIASTSSILSSASSLSLNSMISSPISSRSSSCMTTPITPNFPNMSYGLCSKLSGQGSHVGGGTVYESLVSNSSWNQPTHPTSSAFSGSTSSSSPVVSSLASSSSSISNNSTCNVMDDFASMNQQQQMIDCFVDFQNCNYIASNVSGSGNANISMQINSNNLNGMAATTITSVTTNSERDRSLGNYSHYHPYAPPHSQRLSKNDSLRKLSLSNLKLSSFPNQKRGSSSVSLGMNNMDSIAPQSYSLALA